MHRDICTGRHHTIARVGGGVLRGRMADRPKSTAKVRVCSTCGALTSLMVGFRPIS